MDVEIFSLCDAAADYQGRLSILGVFDSIFATTIPATHPHCTVVARLRFPKIEEGKHNLKLHIVDNDGQLIVPELNGEFGLQLPENTRVGTINLLLALQGLTFNNYGEYAVNLAIDGREVASLPFWLKQPLT